MHYHIYPEIVSENGTRAWGAVIVRASSSREYKGIAIGGIIPPEIPVGRSCGLHYAISMSIGHVVDAYLVYVYGQNSEDLGVLMSRSIESKYDIEYCRLSSRNRISPRLCSPSSILPDLASMVARGILLRDNDAIRLCAIGLKECSDLNKAGISPS